MEQLSLSLSTLITREYDRRSRIKDCIIKQQQLRKRRMISQSNITIQTFALYQIIQTIYPIMFQQSIKFLHQLFGSSKRDINTKINFEYQSIRQCLSSFSQNRFINLYKHSIKLIRNRIIQITTQFQSRTNKDKWNIRIEILAHYIKTIIEFQEYIPNKQNFDPLKPDKLISVLNIEKSTYRALKQKYFEAKRDQVQFYDEEQMNLSVLINTFYILQVRKKCQGLSYKLKEIASYLSNNRQTFLKEEVKRLTGYKYKYSSSKNVEKLDGKFKTFSEEYIRVTNKKKKPYKPYPLLEIEQEATVLEELFKEDAKDLGKHERMVYLLKKYKRAYNYYKVKFVNYKLKMKQYKNNLDSLKQTYITKQIRQKVNVSYEEICRNYYTATLIFISRRYFEDNINNFLIKQLKYQQILYLNNLMNLISTSHNKRGIIFMQVFQLDEPAIGDSKRHLLAVAIDTQGISYCKKFDQTVIFHLQFQEFVDRTVNSMYRSSIIINNEPTFRLEQYFNAKRCKRQKKINLLSCPALSCFPNPCQKIFCAARKFVKLLKETQNYQPLDERTQFVAEKIASISGKELVDVELKKAAFFLGYIGQSSYVRHLEEQITANLIGNDTQQLRELLNTYKLYNQRIQDIKLKQIKIEELGLLN